ncbi:serine/threonine-protein kinase PLK4-like [Paramacrobiotus metropolitanus]|uniref:serine/threonine-protein kinase PLK4-like n=1 Tax=Paramacrobiotus metropolitanus TaxID=2943436 RepID=UPI0024456B50|nr:serine/threonine-protein kinase PLK4-like [Paramacrobiotus metropolitanus]XP_055327405.1 serine/threonine-protein kinase PLK4-like [Paramacrobiotus metropolitanus]XP_055327406.1 serine/threonine-protein kinase PLK4-like [Paramacrobiotus metropolitanus]
MLTEVRMNFRQQDFGTSLESYSISREIGKGGFSHVYEAVAAVRHPNGIFKKKVAVKCVDRRSAQKDILTRIDNERNIHMELNHPSIVQMLQYFDDGNYSYFVLEYCEQDLAHFLDKRPTDENTARHIFRQVVKGLIYLHDKNIIHRDIKPGNILLTANHDAKICDFGLATRYSRSAPEHTTLCGTPAFMAPEVLSNSHTIDSDKWSLGILLYTMVVGCPPKPPSSARGYRAQELSFSAVSAAAADLITSLLQYDAEKRISLEKVLCHPWLDGSSSLRNFTSPNRSADSGHGSFSRPAVRLRRRNLDCRYRIPTGY